MILVTGATGTIGRAVLAELVARNERPRALVRDPAGLVSADRMDVVVGRFEDPGSLDRAMEGVRAALLLSPGGPASPPADLAMVAAARRANIAKLVKLSSIGTGEPFTRGADWHAAGEQAVRESGAAWALVRPSAYAANALRWAPAIRAGQPIPNFTGEAVQGVIDERDVAAVAVAALHGPEHDGMTYTLTGPELLSTADQAALLGAVLGREVRVSDVPLGELERQLIEAGMPPERVQPAVRGLSIIAAGHNAVLTDDVRAVLGRAPRSFGEWASAHRARFEPGSM